MKDKRTFESSDSNDNSNYKNDKYDESDYNTDYTGKLLADHYLEKVRRENEKENNLSDDKINVKDEKIKTSDKIDSKNNRQTKIDTSNKASKEDIEKPIYKQWWFWILLIFAIFIRYTFGFN